MCIRDSAKALLEKSNGKLILPVDSKEANAFADYTEVKDTEGEAVDPGFLGLDIGPKSIAKFDEALTGAKTVVWNGPMGVFENPDFQEMCIRDRCCSFQGKSIPFPVNLLGQTIFKLKSRNFFIILWNFDR